MSEEKLATLYDRMERAVSVLEGEIEKKKNEDALLKKKFKEHLKQEIAACQSYIKDIKSEIELIESKLNKNHVGS